MDIQEIRFKNFLVLLSEADSNMAELARRVDTEAAYLSQIKNKAKTRGGTVRGVGGDLARKLERGMGKPAGWLDNVHDKSEVSSLDELHKIPLMGWDITKKWVHTDENLEHFMDDSKSITSPMAVGARAFALTIEGDAMSPDYPEGGMLIVDPDEPSKPGNGVVALAEGEELPVFRNLSREGGQDVLVPINQRYPIKPCTEILGRAVAYLRKI